MKTMSFLLRFLESIASSGSRYITEEKEGRHTYVRPKRSVPWNAVLYNTSRVRVEIEHRKLSQIARNIACFDTKYA